ncbi:hypothetical protein KZI27_10195 [Curtobacterium sp. TC1]|nr:hypothetical protein KZI27_10195 [Curtobacterium sp. TC1]
MTVEVLEGMIERSGLNVPADALTLLTELPPEQELFVDQFEAAEFERMVRDNYLVRAPNLVELLAPVRDLGNGPILFCQAEAGERIASFVVDAEHQVPLAATYIDRAPTQKTISVGALRPLLKELTTPATLKASAALLPQACEKDLRLSVQDASSIARTLLTKYNLAREKGVVVIGLEEFTTNLALLGSTEVRLCFVWLEDSLVTVALEKERDQVMGALFVTNFIGKPGER